MTLHEALEAINKHTRNQTEVMNTETETTFNLACIYLEEGWHNVRDLQEHLQDFLDRTAAANEYSMRRTTAQCSGEPNEFVHPLPRRLRDIAQGMNATVNQATLREAADVIEKLVKET